jgi:hypothetical protein
LKSGTLFNGWIASEQPRKEQCQQDRLTRVEHEALGATLKQLRDEALRIALVLDTAYAKQSSCARLSNRAAQTLDRLWSALDRQAFLDYCQWEVREKTQFKGSRTYFPGNNTHTND